MKQKKNKGFTLIELLAVIVILAIIALIAVPVIMNIINKANKSAFKDTAYGVIQAGELYYAEQLLEPNGMQENVTITLPDTTKKLQIKGEVPTGSILITTEGKVAIAVHNNRYCVTRGLEDDKVIMTEDIANCTLPSGGAVTPKASLNDYSWAEIQAIAKSDAALIDYNIDIDNDEKNFKTDSGVTYILVDDARSKSYGGLVFMYDSGVNAPMNASNDKYSKGHNNGGYASSEMHNYLNNPNGEVYQALPDDLQGLIKTVNIECNDGYYEADGTTRADGVNQTVSATLFLPSLREVSASKSYDGVEGETFDYFNTDNSFERELVSSSYGWWFRSAEDYYDYLFWFVSYGSLGSTYAKDSYDVFPAFVIG